MKVAKYIQDLLFDHSCVIVPGFGGFLTEYKSAEINPITNVFKAPSTNIAFNASLTKDDGLLRTELALGETVSQEEASELIKKFVQETELSLSEFGEVSIDGLGDFIQKDGHLSFNPKDIANLNIEGFGLNEFKFEPINRNIEEMKHPRPVPPARRVVKRKPSEPVQEVSNKKKVEPEESASNKNSLFLLLPVLFLVVAGGIFGYTEFSKNNNDQIVSDNTEESVATDQASLLDLGSSDNQIIEEGNEQKLQEDVSNETVDSEVQNTFEEPVEEQIEKELSTTTGIVSGTSSSGKYVVIAGVFNSMKNAQKFASNHSNAEVLEIDSYFKVSVESYANFKDAVQALPQLQSKYGSDVWITKR